MSTNEVARLHLRERGNGDLEVAAVSFEERSFAPRALHPQWCRCPADEFHSYPGDGECSCGVYKHHVHCSLCGGISQIG